MTKVELTLSYEQLDSIVVQSLTESYHLSLWVGDFKAAKHIRKTIYYHLSPTDKKKWNKENRQ